MKLIGLNSATNSQGKTTTTLHVADDFNDYYSNAEAGRSCKGMKVESVYVGILDCSLLEVGMNIDIAYDKAVTTTNGRVYQPVKKIEILD